jgi:biopolymer transport protein ExbB
MKNSMRSQLSKHILVAFFVLMPSIAAAQGIEKTDSLVTLANSIVSSDTEINSKRESIFKLALEEQQALLYKSESRLRSAKLLQEELKQEFVRNEQYLADLEAKLSQRSGALGEVFGVAKENALELGSILHDSITIADNPGRQADLAFAESKRIPTIEDINSLLNQLTQEMKATGQVKSFETLLVNEDGSQEKQTVTRYGVFASVNEQGDYLVWDVPGQMLKTLRTQPDHRVENDKVNSESVTVMIDPSRGELFGLLDRMPSLLERIKQGGLVGYVIISLGILGLLIAFYQMVRLVLAEMGVRKQLSSPAELDVLNPLGRVLSSIVNSDSTIKGESNETIEMRVDEAILKELPKIEQGQSFLKLLVAVAPLLGLLGTVVGMIVTFQSINLFGTSDPKLMANGISQALMTTVLGLVVTVPILFCHSLLVARGQRLVQILQEKSLGALITAAEKYATNDSKKGEALHVA